MVYSLAVPRVASFRSVAPDDQPRGLEPSRPKVGLCLSGGGFRAAFYGLGAVRYLSEARLLPSVTAISAISGGSLAAAKIAAHWPAFAEAGTGAFLDTVWEPMRRTVADVNIRNRWLASVASGRGVGRGGRGVVLGEVLRRELGLPLELADLPGGPHVIFTSTCLQTGRAFRFARDFTGSWDFGYVEPTPAGVKLGTALAASAAFPITFTVVRVQTKDLNLPMAVPPEISLVDGGVYDNLGLEWFQGSGSGRPRTTDADFVLVVNASGVLDQKRRRFGAGRAIFRDLSVQYSQTLNVRVRWFVDQLKAAPGSGLYVGINRDPRKYTLIDGRTPIDPQLYDGALPSSLAQRMPLVRTDLDRFSRDETELLAYHGYWSTHSRLATFRPDLAVEHPEWREFADLSPAEEQRLAVILDDARQRSLIRRGA